MMSEGVAESECSCQSLLYRPLESVEEVGQQIPFKSMIRESRFVQSGHTTQFPPPPKNPFIEEFNNKLIYWFGQTP